jgi:hypothetical protein
MNLFDFDRLYRSKVTGKGLTGSVVTLSLGPVEPGKLLRLTNVSVENTTNPYTKLRLTIKHISLVFPNNEAEYPQKDQLIISEDDIMLGENDDLQAIFEGTTTGDVLILIASGFEMTRPR